MYHRGPVDLKFEEGQPNNIAFNGAKAGGEKQLVIKEARDSQNGRIYCLKRTNRFPR